MRRLPGALAALDAPLRDVPGAVFGADPEPPADWAGVEEVLLEAFRMSRAAAEAESPIVFVLPHEDLLGQRGALGAMLANALLSGARTLAFEGVRSNAVAIGADLEHVAGWVEALLRSPGVSGELVRVDAAHVGKVLP